MNYYLGIDVGGTSIKGGVVSEKGDIIFKTASKVTSDALSPLESVISELVKYCK